MRGKKAAQIFYFFCSVFAGTIVSHIGKEMTEVPSQTKEKRDILAMYDRHVDTVYRVCYGFMKNRSEAEDLTQETFLKLMTCTQEFENERHEKAWLIVTASNLCKDSLKKWWRKNEDIENYQNLSVDSGDMDNYVLDAILRLPEEYKSAVYMYYYEGYTTAEIAKHAGCTDSNIRSRLTRARKMLMTILGGVRK